jgi:hypothetical protein
VKDWRERFAALHAREESYWLGRGFTREESGRGELGFRGTITVRIKGEEGLERHDFELRFDYPPGYPYIPPKVTFLNPSITKARHQGVSGAPCLFPTSAWNPDDVPASEMYAASPAVLVPPRRALSAALSRQRSRPQRRGRRLCRRVARAPGHRCPSELRRPSLALTDRSPLELCD